MQAGADAVMQTSQDGWTCGTPLAALTDDRNAMLAIAMNGKPLPVEHGFPVRMVVPGLYGYVSATKWLVDLEVTRFADFDAYWTQRGWSRAGPGQDRVAHRRAPRRPASPAGQVPVRRQRLGPAHRHREGRGASSTAAPWQEAELGRVPDVDTWVQWAGEVDVEPGEHTLVVRATDRSRLHADRGAGRRGARRRDRLAHRGVRGA